MSKNGIPKNKNLYRNGAVVAQPGYIDAKLKDDIALLAELDRCFAEVEGQGYACNAVKEQLFGILNKANEYGPAAIFFFAGPPAVGKTLLAQKIGEALGRPFERFDMSGYSDKEAPISLFGLNKSYKSAAPGRFTTYVKEHPMGIILLDEIEKAHITVRNEFLQILEKGAVYDLFYEREFSVRDCIFIFTSNVGTNAYNTGNPYNLSTMPIPTVIKALEEERSPYTGEPYFSRELVSRFASGKIIVFNKLRPEVMHRIVVRHIQKMRKYYYKEYNICGRMDCDAIADMILFSQGGDADIRSVVRAVNEFFSKNFERMVEMVSGNGYGGRICEINYDIDFSSAFPEATEIFADNKISEVLVFGGSIMGNIPKKMRAGIEIFSIKDVLSVHEIKRRGPATVVICVTHRNEAKAKELFDNLIAIGTPTYVYTKDSGISLKYYAENGAVDCFTPHKEISFNDWISGSVRGIALSKASEKLFRANKVITFATSYKYFKKTCSIKVTLSDFATRIAYGGGESSLFAGKASIPDVTFDDIIGAEEAKREFAPVIRQLKKYREYKRNGIRIPRGIILDGPPGSGKTSIAKAVANAAGLPFISLNATEFLSKWVGAGEQKIRDTFAAARRYAPSLIFIDEIDCIAKDRMSSVAESSHTEGLTNALLSELDGFNSQDAAPVFVIAATNFDTRSGDSKLDKAFLRRFDKKIHIDLPKVREREQFIVRELARYDFSVVSKAAISGIAKRSSGWSLADLNLVIQNAVRHSESDSGFSLTDEVLEEAFSSFNAGIRKDYDEQDAIKTAYHEAGHAVVAELLGFKPLYTTIVSRGNYGGYTQYSDEDKFDFTCDECLNRICIAMAGRAAEVCFYGKDGINTGAGGDIRSATDMATRMVCSYGMEDGMLCCVEKDKAVENVAIYKRICEILSKQYGHALQLVRDNADKVDSVAKALVARESLTESELQTLISIE